eukprot:jgi/Hompol1/1066/HPOL_005504-RA
MTPDDCVAVQPKDASQQKLEATHVQPDTFSKASTKAHPTIAVEPPAHKAIGNRRGTQVAAQSVSDTSSAINTNATVETTAGAEAMEPEAKVRAVMSHEPTSPESTSAVAETTGPAKEPQVQLSDEASEFEREQREQRQRRLKFLVERAGIYSKWLAEKLDARQQEIAEAAAAAKSESNERQDQDANDSTNKTGDDDNEQDIVDPDPDPDPEQASALLTRRRSTRRSATNQVPSRPSADESVSKKRKGKVADKVCCFAAAVLALCDTSILTVLYFTECKSATKRHRKATFGLDTNRPSITESIPKRQSRQPLLVSGGEMREYQLVGMEWLISLYDNGLNGILADEMGLGKSLQTIAFLAHLREMGTLGPFLIVAPLSTLANWVSEIERFTPLIPVVLYYGSAADRAHIRNHKMKFSDSNFPIFVTSYEICMNDRRFLQNVKWRYIIVDEGHRIKNLNCKLVRELKSYTSANRLLLTGTPLQNNLSELWSLLNFLMPDIFDDLGAFEEWFDFTNDLSVANGQQSSSLTVLDKETNAWLVNSLHHILKPFLLRRLKTEVAIDLPKKREYLLYAPMVPKQRELYDAARQGVLASMITESIAKNYGAKIEKSESTPEPKTVSAQKLQNVVMQLRKICNHPYLFDIDDGNIEQDLPVQHVSTDMIEKKHAHSKLPEIVSWSGKMLILERLLPELFERGHKVLIFSQMTRMLDIIGDWCMFVKKWRYCRIDGNVNMEDRRMQMHEFNKPGSDVNLFLLSTRAGGLGINLTAADTVIIYDSDWNPQADLQAQDRVHRIGQKKPVIIYRLVTAGSIERHILDKAQTKRKLEKLVIHKGHFKGSGGYYKSNKATSTAELADLLDLQDTQQANSGNYETVDGIPLPSSILTDEELGRILDRSPESYETVSTDSGAGTDNDKFKVMVQRDQEDLNETEEFSLH